MSNKRITELVPINLAEINESDLLVVADVSVPESKKLTMADMASWVAYSASLTLVSSSYSDTASYLLYNGYDNGTSSFAISCSYALATYYAYTALSSSHAITSSYSFTASYLDGTISEAFVASSAYTASHLLYNGYYNGSASYALSSSVTQWANTSSYVQWYGGNVDNGTVFRSISSSFASTASYINVSLLPKVPSSSLADTASYTLTSSYLTGSNTGTASYALAAATAATANAVSNITNAYIFRESGPYYGVINGATASLVTINIPSGTPTIYVETLGDIQITSTLSSSLYTTASTIGLYVSNSAAEVYPLNISSQQYTFTSSNTNYTCSYVTGFYLKGYLNSTATDWHFYVASSNTSSINFYTSSRSVQCYVKINNDTWTIL